MSLAIKQSTTLEGMSEINDSSVMSMTATISAETKGNSYFNQSIINQELYNQNKKECRADLKAFQDAVFDIEDNIGAVESGRPAEKE